MTRVLILAIPLLLGGCGLPAASIVSLIAAGITLATHAADDATQIYTHETPPPAKP